MFHLFGGKSHSHAGSKAFDTVERHEQGNPSYKNYYDDQYDNPSGYRYSQADTMRRSEEEMYDEPRKEKKSGGWFSNLLSGGTSSSSQHHDHHHHHPYDESSSSSYTRKHHPDIDKSGYQLYRYKPEESDIAGDNGYLDTSERYERREEPSTSRSYGRYDGGVEYSSGNSAARYRDDRDPYEGYNRYSGRERKNYGYPSYEYDSAADRSYGYERENREKEAFGEKPSKVGGRWDRLVGGVQSTVGKAVGSENMERRGELRRGIGDAKVEPAYRPKYSDYEGEPRQSYPRDRFEREYEFQ